MSDLPLQTFSLRHMTMSNIKNTELCTRHLRHRYVIDGLMFPKTLFLFNYLNYVYTVHCTLYTVQSFNTDFDVNYIGS